MNLIKRLSWRKYHKKMKNTKVLSNVCINLNKIGISLHLDIKILKDDIGLSKQLTAFGFREPLNWKNYYEFVESNDIVLDIGANIGLFSMLSLRAKELIAIEPVSKCIPILIENLKNSSFKNAIVIEKAVGKDVKLEINKEVNLSKVSKNGIPVESITLKEACKQYNPTLLRMDVEGYEYEILKYGIPDCVKKICLEFHTKILGNEKALEIVDLFEKNNFKVCLMIEDLPLRLYPYYRFLRYTGLIKLFTYVKKNLSYDEVRDLLFRGRSLKYFLLRRYTNVLTGEEEEGK